MKIVKRIKSGYFKGYTIRISKSGWFALYSSSGISQTIEPKSLEEINELIASKNK